MSPPSDAVVLAVLPDLSRRLGIPDLTFAKARAVIVGFGGSPSPWTHGDGWSGKAREMIAAYETTEDGAERTDWRDVGSVSCACDRRGENCSCRRFLGAEADEHGDPKLRFQEVQDMTKRIDSHAFDGAAVARIDADDDADPVAARQRMVQRNADAWKAKDVPPTTPTATSARPTFDADDDPVGRARAKLAEWTANAWKIKN